IHTDSSSHFFDGALPNTPNFRLGVLKGSDCDTIREVKPPSISDGVLLYPNPCRDELLVNSKWLIGNTGVVVYNILGQKELSLSLKNSLGIETIYVSSLAKAIYLLQIIDAIGTIHNCKFVKE
ncbi:MAG: Secretion system C-terminal sorting domain, partial [Bacteroidota bacterium]